MSSGPGPEQFRSRPALARSLDLDPHPEGGWFRETWRAPVTVAPPGYPGPRACATGIHYVLGPGEESRWHQVRSDELWLWHRGAALSLWVGGEGDGPDPAPREIVLGPRVEDGQTPQALVPAGHWQRARPHREPNGVDTDSGAVLVSCVVSPGFDFADFRTLDP